MYVLLLVFTSPAKLFSQEKANITFGTVSAEDFNRGKYTIGDSSTSAIIIADIGSTKFVGNKKGWFSQIFNKKTRLIIFNQTAFDLAVKRIFLYTKSGETEKLIDFSASVYNIENGVITKTNIDPKELFEEKKNKNFIEKKIAFPGVKAGSIIEYSYTISSDFNFLLPSWSFQNTEYPCLWSEYQVSIPGLLSYRVLKQGVDSFYINKASETYDGYSITKPAENYLGATPKELQVNTSTSSHRWVIRNVQPLKIENYVSSPENYIDKIDFQLYQVSDGEVTTDVFNDWKKASAELLADNTFGSQLDQNADWLKTKLNEFNNPGNNQLKVATNIYLDIRDHFTCTNYDDYYIRSSLKNVFNSNNGNVGEINLLYILMLRKKGIEAEPVLLSTKENGFVFANYPFLEKFNYLICKVYIAGYIYYVDCTHPNLAFGNLPYNCYNGEARIINAERPLPLYLNADLIKDQKKILVLISGDEAGNLTGSFTSTTGLFESYEIREIFAKAKKDDYIKSWKARIAENISPSNLTFDSIKNVDAPVKIQFDFTVDNSTGETFYFNPLIADYFKKNPFTAAERNYPVEMPYCIDKTYLLNMEIPAGYQVAELPKSVKFKLNEKDGLFEYIIVANNKYIQLKCRLQINKANFAASDYQALRDFYAFVVKKEAEQIIFKKK